MKILLIAAVLGLAVFLPVRPASRVAFVVPVRPPLAFALPLRPPLALR